MLLRKKGQSTAEYAILLGLVAAVAAGFLSVGLKGAVRSKAKQTTNFLLQAGNKTLDTYADKDVPLFNQEHSETTVKGGDDYANKTVMEKGGLEKRYQKQTTTTDSVSIETLEAE